MVAQEQPPLVVVVGETGSGKSSLAIKLAKKFNGEIISADSWAVYRGFDIGSAKPTLVEQSQIKHHLIDIVEASKGFNAAQYKKSALEVIDDIHSRGKLPILVGGTGLYVDSIIFDFSFLPPGDFNKRTKRNKSSITELLSEIEAAGINTSGIDIRNKRRLIRLLEANGQRPTQGKIRSGTLAIGLQVPRDQLRQRISKRVDEMLAQGLEREVHQLAKLYNWEIEPMKGIGYQQWQKYFEGTQNLELTRERIISATMNLAKRQRTWFKRNYSIQWVQKQSEAVALVTTFLNKNSNSSK